MVQTADAGYPQLRHEPDESGADAFSVEDMTQIPELERKSRQHDEDIYSIYELMRELDVRFERRFNKVESRLDAVESRLDAVAGQLGTMEELLREIVGLLRSSGR